MFWSPHWRANSGGGGESTCGCRIGVGAVIGEPTWIGSRLCILKLKPFFRQGRGIQSYRTLLCWRPYRVECTGSLPTSEVKRRRARLVLRVGDRPGRPQGAASFSLLPVLVQRRSNARRTSLRCAWAHPPATVIVSVLIREGHAPSNAVGVRNACARTSN